MKKIKRSESHSNKATTPTSSKLDVRALEVRELPAGAVTGGRVAMPIVRTLIGG